MNKIISPVLVFNESLKQIVRDNERAEVRRKKAIRQKKVDSILGAQYLAAMHQYQLVVNGKPEGDPVEMLGAEAKVQNDIFKQRFRDDINAAIDAGKPFGQTGAVSRHWKWIK